MVTPCRCLHIQDSTTLLQKNPSYLIKVDNIGMQETHHLDRLSTALHLLRPSMKTFRSKHRACKFQVATTIVCHTAVDTSVVTQPPVTLTSEMIAVYAADAAPPLDEFIRQLLNFPWVFPHFQDLQLTLWQMDPFLAR